MDGLLGPSPMTSEERRRVQALAMAGRELPPDLAAKVQASPPLVT